MENRSNDLLVGSFVLLFVLAALGFIVWLARVDVGGDSQLYRIYVRQAVTGLQVGSPVRFLGVPVGVVKDIRIDPETMNRVRIEVEVPVDTPIRTDSTASLEQQGLTGGVFVQISPGSDGAAMLKTATAGDAVPEIRASASQITELLESAPQLLENLIELSRRMTLTLSDENIKAFNGTLSHVEAITGELADASKQTGPLIASASQLLDTYNDLGKQTGTRLGKLLDHTDTAVSGMSDASAEVFDSMKKASQSVWDASQATSKMVGKANAVLDDNRGPLKDFTSSGLYELTYLFQELRGLVSNLTLLTERIERAPSEFLFGSSSQGVKPE